jgi:hypothetical protein
MKRKVVATGNQTSFDLPSAKCLPSGRGEVASQGAEVVAFPADAAATPLSRFRARVLRELVRTKLLK